MGGARSWCQPLGGLKPMSTPQNYCCQCLCPCSEPQPAPTATGDPLIPGGMFGPSSYEVTAFPLGPDAYQTFFVPPSVELTSLVAQRLKHLSGMQETWVRSLGQENPLEKEMAAHSSSLAWRILWKEEPGGLQSMGSQRVGYD